VTDIGGLFASGRIVDLALAFMALEALILLAWRRLGGRVPAPFRLLPSLAAGACLLLALRASLTGAEWPLSALWLTFGLISHLADLWLRRPVPDVFERREVNADAP
jgi:hypothetical protein